MNLEEHIKSAELNGKYLEAKEKKDRVIIDKVSELRFLLSEHWIAGTDDKLNFIPLLNDEEVSIVKKKLMYLIDKF